jgi:hypothetical protein
MALDPTSTDPCSLLNSNVTNGYPTLLINSGAADTTAFPLIAAGGKLVPFLDTLRAISETKLSNNNILVDPKPTSNSRLIQFLSGGGVASVDPANNYTKLGGVALSVGSPKTYKSIVDSYIMGTEGLNKSDYTYTSATGNTRPPIPNTQIWNPSDSSNGEITNPTSLLGKLIAAGFLLSEREIYQPSQLGEGAIVATGSESLVYLYRIQQDSGNLSSAQLLRKNKLEATNLRFFGAFMAEYCYYRTRYEWLLQKYFEIYAMPPATSTTSPKYSSSQPVAVAALFGTGLALPGTSTTNSLNQIDYLDGLSYQMSSLNTRIVDMRRLLSQINMYYSGVFTLIQSDINSSTVSGGNAALTDTITALQSSSEEAGKYLSDSDFAKEAMNYNSEKNRYSNILLGLYAFLNIAALATVFQLART